MVGWPGPARGAATVESALPGPSPGPERCAASYNCLSLPLLCSCLKSRCLSPKAPSRSRSALPTTRPAGACPSWMFTDRCTRSSGARRPRRRHSEYGSRSLSPSPRQGRRQGKDADPRRVRGTQTMQRAGKSARPRREARALGAVVHETK